MAASTRGGAVDRERVLPNRMFWAVTRTAANANTPIRARSKLMVGMTAGSVPWRGIDKRTPIVSTSGLRPHSTGFRLVLYG